MSAALMLRMQWSVSSTLPLLLRLENTSTSSLTVESPLSSLYVLTSLSSLPLLLAETREMCVCWMVLMSHMRPVLVPSRTLYIFLPL